MFTLAFLSCSSVLLPIVLSFFLYMTDGSFILPAVKDFYCLPLKCFCLGVGVLPDHPLVYQLLSHHHLPMLAVPNPITKQKVLFCLLAHHGILVQIRVGILSHYPSWHALVIPTHLSLFWVVCYPSGTFLPKEFEREPQNKLSPSPHRQTISFFTFNPRPPYIGWVQVGGA